MAYDVFISHSTKDKQTADAVCHFLEQNNIRCWMAPRDILPGKEWAEAIFEAIGNCRLMLLIFSSNANNSDQIKRELNLASNAKIPIIPLRLEDVPMSGTFQFFLGTPHWLDAMSPPLEQHLDRLADSVKILLSHIPDTPKPKLPDKKEAKSETPISPSPEPFLKPVIEEVPKTAESFASEKREHPNTTEKQPKQTQNATFSTPTPDYLEDEKEPDRPEPDETDLSQNTQDISIGKTVFGLDANVGALICYVGVPFFGLGIICGGLIKQDTKLSV